MDPIATLESTPIEGVQCHPLQVIEDNRGALLHMIREDAPIFTRFGEVYFSEVKPGVIKGWKRHRLMTQRFAVPVGRMNVVVFDDRETSSTRGQVAQFHLGRPDHYRLLVLPPLVWYAFQCVSVELALMANCADLPHDPTESEQRRLEEPGFPKGCFQEIYFG